MKISDLSNNENKILYKWQKNFGSYECKLDNLRNIPKYYYKKALFTAFCYDWNKIAEFAGFCSNHLYAHMVDWLWKKQKTIKSKHFWIRIYTWSNLTKISWKLSDFHHIIGARNILLICSGMRIEMSVQKWFSPILKKDKPNPRP